MNTLSRAQTAQIFANSEAYQMLRTHWSHLVNSEQKHELTAEHHFLYLALLGKDWRKAFSPVTNPRKLANGAFYGWKLFHALASLHLPSAQDNLLAPFEGLVTPEMLSQLRHLVPPRTAYMFKPEQFLTNTFPFEAYEHVDSSGVKQGKTSHAG